MRIIIIILMTIAITISINNTNSSNDIENLTTIIVRIVITSITTTIVIIDIIIIIIIIIVVLLQCCLFLDFRIYLISLLTGKFHLSHVPGIFCEVLVSLEKIFVVRSISSRGCVHCS